MGNTCPFCGSSTVGLFAGRQAKYVVTCLGPGCGATGPEGSTPAEAVGRWRTRHRQPGVPEAAPPHGTAAITEAQPAAGIGWGPNSQPGPLALDASVEKQALIQHSLETFRTRLHDR